MAARFPQDHKPHDDNTTRNASDRERSSILSSTNSTTSSIPPISPNSFPQSPNRSSIHGSHEYSFSSSKRQRSKESVTSNSDWQSSNSLPRASLVATTTSLRDSIQSGGSLGSSGGGRNITHPMPLIGTDKLSPVR